MAVFIDAISLTINKALCVQEIENRSPNKKRTIQAQEIDNKLAEVEDFYNLCNGHDFEKAFALHITANTSGKKGVKDEDIGKALRIAYRKQDFESTILYASLREWEIKSGYFLF